MSSRVTIAVVAVLLLFSIAVNLHLRKDAFLPNHGDEWELVANVLEMQKQEKVVFSSPVTGEPIDSLRHRLEANYGLFVLSFLNLSGIDPLLLPFALSVLFSFLLGVSAFAMVRDFTKNSLAAFIAAFFVFGLKNSIALFGYAFMVPLAFGIAALPLLFYTFITGLDSGRRFLVFSILTLNSFFTHPASPVLIAPAAFVFFLFNPKLLAKNFTRVFALAVLVFSLGFFAVWTLPEKNFSSSVLSLFVFPYDGRVTNYPLLTYIHPLELSAVTLGLLMLLFFSMPKPYWLKQLFGKAQNFLKTDFRAGANFALFSLIFAMVWLYLRVYSDTANACFFAPCSHTAPGVAVFLLLIAGLGVFFLYKTLLETVFRARGGAESLLNIVAGLLLAVLLAQYVFAAGFQYKSGFYNAISPRQIADMLWMKNLPGNSIVFSPGLVPKTIAAVAGKKAPGVFAAETSGTTALEEEFDPGFIAGSRQKNPAQEIGWFPYHGCSNQKTIVKKYSITHAYWDTQKECVLADRVFDGGDWHVSKFVE